MPTPASTPHAHPERGPLPSPRLQQLREALARGHGTLTSADLNQLGFGPETVRQLVRARLLLRVGRGAFVDAALHRAADQNGRHVLRATAIARTWPPEVLVSHSSGALMHGLPLVARPEQVHGCRRASGQHRRTDRYTIHTAYPGASSATIHGVDVLEPRFVVLGVAELLGRDAAVMVGDAALHRQLVTRAGLEAAADSRLHHSAHAAYLQAVKLMDHRTESPGETGSRLLLLSLGYRPIPQVVIHEGDGTFLARVDFLLEGTRVIVEFDGMGKYASHEDLVAEKRREMRLRRAGYVVVRLTWADLGHPERVRILIQGALAGPSRSA